MERPRIILTPELIDQLSALKVSDHDEYGREVPNPVSLYENVDIDKPPLTLNERIQRMLHSEFSRQAYDQGFESAEEASDFEITDDFEAPLPVTPHEMVEEFPSEPQTAQQPPPEVLEEPTTVPEEPDLTTPDPA